MDDKNIRDAEIETFEDVFSAYELLRLWGTLDDYDFMHLVIENNIPPYKELRHYYSPKHSSCVVALKKDKKLLINIKACLFFQNNELGKYRTDFVNANGGFALASTNSSVKEEFRRSYFMKKDLIELEQKVEWLTEKRTIENVHCELFKELLDENHIDDDAISSMNTETAVSTLLAQNRQLRAECEGLKEKLESGPGLWGVIKYIVEQRDLHKSCQDVAKDLAENYKVSATCIGILLHPSPENITDRPNGFGQYGRDLIAGKPKKIAW